MDLSVVDTYMNPVYLPYLTDYRRYQVLKGGAGAGKSVFIGGQKIVYNMIAAPGYNVMALRKVGVDSRNSTFAEIKKGIRAWGLEGLFNVTVSPMEVTCKATGNKCLFFGLDDVEKRKSVTFDTGDLAAIWVEEASEVTQEDFVQLDLRLRGEGKVPKHIMLSLNPIDIDLWIKKYFFDRPLKAEDGFILETTYADNQFLDEAYKKHLEELKDIDDHYYRVYVLNEWGSRSSATVFHNLVIEDFDFVEDDFENRRFGMDFGFNHANALVGVGYRDGELYIWREDYAKHQLNRDFILAVKERELPMDYTIKADSAEPDKIVEWVDSGFRYCMGTTKYPGSLYRGVHYLRDLPKIHIHATRCPNAAREFPRFKYRTLKDGTVLDKEFVELDDDTIAATRYAVDDLVGDVAGSGYFIKRKVL